MPGYPVHRVHFHIHAKRKTFSAFFVCLLNNRFDDYIILMLDCIKSDEIELKMDNKKERKRASEWYHIILLLIVDNIDDGWVNGAYLTFGFIFNLLLSMRGNNNNARFQALSQFTLFLRSGGPLTDHVQLKPANRFFAWIFCDNINLFDI